MMELRPKQPGTTSCADQAKPWRQLRLGLLEGTRLFLIFGTYAWLMLTVAVALAVFPLWATPDTTWWGVVLWVLALMSTFWAMSVLSQFPKKIALVRRYRWSLAQNQFQPEHIAHLCGDPCYRLVASQILLGSEYRSTRRALIAQLNEQNATFGLGKVHVDPERGVLVLYNGKEMG